MSVPKLRFKQDNGMDYPAWEMNTLKNVSYYVVTTAKGTKNSFVGTENMKKGCAGVSFDDDTETAVKGVAYMSDDILVSNIRPYLQKAWKSDRKGICSNDVLCIRGNGVINSDFLYVIISSSNFFDYVMQGVKGTKMPRGDKKHIMDMPVSIPSLPEQKKIANFLSTVDEVIAQSEAEVQNLEQQKKAAMQKIFSQEVRFKREDGTEFPEWEEKTLQDCTQFIKDGTHATHKNTEQGYYLLSAKDVYDGAIHTFEDSRIISKDDYNTIYKQYSLNVGDVILTIVGTLGRVAVVTKNDIDVAFQRSVAIIRPNETTDSYYLRYEMEDTAFQNELDIRKSRGAQAGVYLGVLSEIIMKMPCLEEQQKIADFLSAYDEAITNAKAELNKWKELKKGLLQQMFV